MRMSYTEKTLSYTEKTLSYTEKTLRVRVIILDELYSLCNNTGEALQIRCL